MLSFHYFCSRLFFISNNFLRLSLSMFQREYTFGKVSLGTLAALQSATRARAKTRSEKRESYWHDKWLVYHHRRRRWRQQKSQMKKSHKNLCTCDSVWRARKCVFHSNLVDQLFAERFCDEQTIKICPEKANGRNEKLPIDTDDTNDLANAKCECDNLIENP